MHDLSERDFVALSVAAGIGAAGDYACPSWGSASL
jgi:hypothetical protein